MDTWEYRKFERDELENPSIAGTITAKLNATSCMAVTLYGGYAMPYKGDRILFQGGRIGKERRNANGRVTFLECSYSDGSRIEFTWSEDRGGSYRAFRAKVACAA